MTHPCGASRHPPPYIRRRRRTRSETITTKKLRLGFKVHRHDGRAVRSSTSTQISKGERHISIDFRRGIHLLRRSRCSLNSAPFLKPLHMPAVGGFRERRQNPPAGNAGVCVLERAASSRIDLGPTRAGYQHCHDSALPRTARPEKELKVSVLQQFKLLQHCTVAACGCLLAAMYHENTTIDIGSRKFLTSTSISSIIDTPGQEGVIISMYPPRQVVWVSGFSAHVCSLRSPTLTGR